MLNPFHILIPSWKLFDRPGDSFRLFYQTKIDTPFILFERNTTRRKTWSLFSNPEDLMWLQVIAQMHLFCERVADGWNETQLNSHFQKEILSRLIFQISPSKEIIAISSLFLEELSHPETRANPQSDRSVSDPLDIDSFDFDGFDLNSFEVKFKLELLTESEDQVSHVWFSHKYSANDLILFSPQNGIKNSQLKKPRF